MKEVIGIGIGVIIIYLAVKHGMVEATEEITYEMNRLQDPIEAPASNEWGSRNKDVWNS